MPAFGSRMICTGCGMIGADARPRPLSGAPFLLAVGSIASQGQATVSGGQCRHQRNFCERQHGDKRTGAALSRRGSRQASCSPSIYSSSTAMTCGAAASCAPLERGLSLPYRSRRSRLVHHSKLARTMSLMGQISAMQWSAPLGVDSCDAVQLAICRACSSSNLTGLLYPSAEWRRLAL